MNNKHSSHRPLDQPLGYTFLPWPHPGHPGSRGLRVIITQEPTLKHYDPQRIRATIFTEKHLFATIVISHPWPGDTRYRYGPGLIRINDRLGEIVDAYSMGGDLTITQFADRTEVDFLSDAPIYPKIDFDHITSLIASEIEGMIARQRAHWLGKLPDFERMLWDLPPGKLYQICITDLISKHQGEFTADRTRTELYQFMLNEQHRITNLQQDDETIR